MPVDWNAEVVDQLEQHWHAQLRPRLDGLTDDEYLWEPVPGCWTLTRRDGALTLDHDWEPRERDPLTTIAWRLAHLADVFGSPAASPFDGSASARPAVVYADTAAGALRQLDEGYDAWLRAVRGLGAEGLARPQGDLSPPEYAEAPLARLVLFTHVEVVHHGAEVCLLRDLYHWSGGASLRQDAGALPQR